MILLTYNSITKRSKIKVRDAVKRLFLERLHHGTGEARIRV
jgi:hypothetical protein